MFVRPHIDGPTVARLRSVCREANPLTEGVKR